MCPAYAWHMHGVRMAVCVVVCVHPLLPPAACRLTPCCSLPPASRRTATLRGGAQAFTDGSAVVSRPAADGPGCAVPDELSPAWFLRRFAWYSRHVTAAPGLRLRMLPAIRVAAAHRRRHARPWNDTDFSASAATRGRRAFNPSLLQRARRAHATSFAASSALNRL